MKTVTTGRGSRSSSATKSSCARPSWPFTTVLWCGVAAAVPLNYALPGIARALWFITIMSLICVPILFLRVARPLYPVIWLFGGFASLLAIVTATKSAEVTENLFVGAQLFILLGLGSFVLTYEAVRDPRFVNRVAVAFVIGQTLSASIAVVQLSGLSIRVPGFIYGAVYGRASGLTEHPNTLGIMACIAVLVTLKISVSTRKLRGLVLLALGTNVLGIVASGSFTAMLALGVGLAVLVVCMRDSLGRMALWGVVSTAFLGLVVTATGAIDYFPSLSARYAQVTGSSETSSWAARQLTYDYAWRSIAESPLMGNGLGAQTSGTYNGVITVHNVILRSWFQGGPFLGVAFALIVVAMGVGITKAMLRRRHGTEAAVIAAVLTYAAVSPLFEQRHFWLPLLVAWASMSAHAYHRHRTAGAEGSSGGTLIAGRSTSTTQRAGRRRHGDRSTAEWHLVASTARSGRQ
ncbi:O-antigen ligase family protein [Mycolicibacterium lacusdiani]|uniref:O-antigen ligase family protein n=1 Tax=Mycolicibacterium lacusdiani TaxID=2895283 RepID=UPI001F38EC81|nr:O-antigen ligase family protein [Mycolicibacterium lacusdiani]